MGKVYTFIHKDKVNKKVFTSRIQEYLNDGGEVGNWNQKELNSKSGAGVKRAFNNMRENGSGDEGNKKRGRKVSEGLFNFGETVDQNYIDKREIKKKTSRDSGTDEENGPGRDIEKVKYAKKNKLNYIVIYSDEFEEFINCIKENKLGSLVKQL